MRSATDYLFVYGTLLQGFDNDFAKVLHKQAQFQGNGSFPGMLYAVSWYPGATHDPTSATRVYGEIYKMTDAAAMLHLLDEYEEVTTDEQASMYLRRIIPITLEGGTVLNCWTYLYNQPVTHLLKIESGKFGY